MEVTYDHQDYAVPPTYPSTRYLYSSTYLSSLPTTYLPTYYLSSLAISYLLVISTYLSTYLSVLPTIYLPTCHLDLHPSTSYLPPTHLVISTYHLPTHLPTHLPVFHVYVFCGKMGSCFGLRQWGGLLLTDDLGQRC